MRARSPLRIGWPRLRLWAIGLTVIGLAPVVGAFVNAYHDWPAFWSAGATVGTPDLVPADAHIAWQRDHGFRMDHLLLSPECADRMVAAGVDKAYRGREKASDHTPVWVELV